MQNINLRRFKEKDLLNVNVCFVEKSIPVMMFSEELGARAILNDYMKRNMEIEIALAIVNENDDCVGAFDGMFIDDILLVSYYVMKSYQGRGIATEALQLFIEYIRKNYSNVKQIKCLVQNENIGSKIVLTRNKFKPVRPNEFACNWILNL